MNTFVTTVNIFLKVTITLLLHTERAKIGRLPQRPGMKHLTLLGRKQMPLEGVRKRERLKRNNKSD